LRGKTGATFTGATLLHEGEDLMGTTHTESGTGPEREVSHSGPAAIKREDVKSKRVPGEIIRNWQIRG